MAKQPQYDVFLSHSHADAVWVEALAKRLADRHSFSVWLDRWVLVPGRNWQQEMARGLDQARSCAVCVNNTTPAGWFRQEIERALNLQSKNEKFGVIPVLLPDATPEVVEGFLSLRTWADFRREHDEEYAFHVLSQGIRGVPIGRWPVANLANDRAQSLSAHERQILELQRFRTLGVHEEVVIEFERKILAKWFESRE